MALGELGAVGTEHHGVMSEARRIRSERLREANLPCGVGEVIVAANHVSDSHGEVVDDRGEVVAGNAI